MSNKIGRIVEKVRKTKNAYLYKVETLTTDLLTVVDTLTCAAIATTPSAGDLVVLVEVQGKLFITGSGGGDMNTLGQVTSVADDGQLTVALYEDGSTNPLTATTHDRKASTQSVTAFQEAYGATDLKVNAWVKCYQLQDVWYVNNLDWTTAASEDLGTSVPVDFMIDNMDASPNDFDPLSTGWVTEGGFFIKLGGFHRAAGALIYYIPPYTYTVTAYVTNYLYYAGSAAASLGRLSEVVPMTYSSPLRSNAIQVAVQLDTLASYGSCCVAIKTPNEQFVYCVFGVIGAQLCLRIWLQSSAGSNITQTYIEEIVYEDLRDIKDVKVIVDGAGYVTASVGGAIFTPTYLASLAAADTLAVGLGAYSAAPDGGNPDDYAVVQEFKAWVTDKGEPVTNEMGHGSIVEGAIVWEDEYHDESGNYLL